MASDTVRLISTNPRKRRRRNPTTARVLGQPFVLPKIGEAVAAVAGVASAATMPKLVAKLPGGGAAPIFAEGGYANILTSWGVNALIGGLSRKWVGTEKATTFIVASSAVSVMQLSYKLTGGKFGLPALPSAMIPLPGGTTTAPAPVPATGVRMLPPGRNGYAQSQPQVIPAMAGARRGVGSTTTARTSEGEQVFFSTT